MSRQLDHYIEPLVSEERFAFYQGRVRVFRRRGRAEHAPLGSASISCCPTSSWASSVNWVCSV